VEKRFFSRTIAKRSPPLRRSRRRFSQPRSRLAARGATSETLHKDGKALGLPVTLVIDKDGCEIGAVEGGAKWDSAEAQALVAALKGG
jgi:hypothetical protein